MRITKSTLRNIKIRLGQYVKDITRMNSYQLKTMVKNTYPNMIIHVTGCPNCGAEMDTGMYECKCSPAERAVAKSSQSDTECIRVLLAAKLEEVIPSGIVE